MWLLISLFAYLLNAIAITVDKFLLSKKISNPAVYTFFISALSLLAIIMAPFGMQWYGTLPALIGIIGGIFFTGGLLYMFKALEANEASRITPIIGGMQPLWILIFAALFLRELLTAQSLIAFALIILGTIAISWERKGGSRAGYGAALIATLLFAISYTINKYVFIDQDFITGFVWTRIGAFLGALTLLFSAVNRHDIWQNLRHGEQKTGSLFIFGQIAGSISFILVNYAIAISPSVALVNALQGVQYVFLLVFVIILSKKFPQILNEKMTRQILIQKILATAIIIAGLSLLFI